MGAYKAGLIVNKSKFFAARIMKFCEKLKERKLFDLSSQLFRSGTSIAANVFESQNSESLIDFIHKMKIAAKEATETELWLYLCEVGVPDIYEDSLNEDCRELSRILGKIISTSKAKLKDS
jgi:four helix bundle protein